MKLYLYGTDNRYSAEQILLSLFPSERPEFPSGEPEGDCCVIAVKRRAVMTVCRCTLNLPSGVFRGAASVANGKLCDKDAEARYTGRIIKLAFYRAALRSGVPKPEWGCLTGVRPTKLMSAYLRDGCTYRSAAAAFARDYCVSPKRAELCARSAAASLRAEELLNERDVCLYVGIPFCPTRCDYCSFVSQSVEKSMKLIEPYLDALMVEIDAAADAVRRSGLRPVALYIGGGTPTTLSPGQLERLCSRLEEAFDLSHLREYTVEAGRPDTITAEKLEVLHSHGVDRVSVNPQTMSDSVLEAIGRRHTARDVEDALALVRSVGGFAVNMDMIAGLNSDTPEGFAESLRRVLSLAPENVTVHTLSLKRGSRLKSEGGDLPTGGEVRVMLDGAIASLEAAGYSPYYLYRQKFMSGGFENVGWSKPGRESLYNICIMEELCGIISMGAGGSTKLVSGGRIERLFAPKYPNEYINASNRVRGDKERIVGFYGV